VIREKLDFEFTCVPCQEEHREALEEYRAEQAVIGKYV
jgi:hypothetical protein